VNGEAEQNAINRYKNPHHEKTALFWHSSQREGTIADENRHSPQYSADDGLGWERSLEPKRGPQAKRSCNEGEWAGGGYYKSENVVVKF